MQINLSASDLANQLLKGAQQAQSNSSYKLNAPFSDIYKQLSTLPQAAAKAATPSFNDIRQKLDQILPAMQQGIKAVASLPASQVASTFIPPLGIIPKQYSPTVGQATNTLADFTYRPPARVGAELNLSVNNQPSFTPTTPGQKLLYGSNPIQSFQQQQKQGSQALQNFGVNKNFANPLATAGVAGMAALDIAPVLPEASAEKVGAKLVEKATATDLAKEVANTLRRNKPGAFTNVRTLDNPLLLGADWATKQGKKLLTGTSSQPGATAPLQATHDFTNEVYQRAISGEVKNKVNLLDYLRTPDRVFTKLGLQNEANNLRNAYDQYQVALPKELDKITQWQKRAPQENQAIFQWLDGNKGVTLSSQGLQIAKEIKNYLKGWAVKLGLPEDKQISNYITHIFPQGLIQKEIDPETAKLISGQVAKSVYDPFLQKRVNHPEYLQDTWQALNAYTKRAVRKYYVDQGLTGIADKAASLPQESYNYVKAHISHVNMQPTNTDVLIDNFIKSTPIGYRLGARPTAALTQKARSAVFRGLLGLNPGSALRNLQQSTNTYATLGEKSFLQGAIKTVQNLPRFLTGQDTELEQAGVLSKGIIQDLPNNPVARFWQKADPVLFYMFNQAEKVNRSIAYFGGKAQALDKGLSEEKAIEYAKGIVRKTQFNYDVLDTPVVLQSDLMKTIFQFANYPVKQTEFLAELSKAKGFSGSIRWLGSNMLFIGALGKTLGLTPADMFPKFKFGAPPTLQAPVGLVEGLAGTPDQYGNVPSGNPIQRVLQNKNFQSGITNYIPAGGQIKRTLEAQKAINEGGSYTPSGNLRFPIEHKAQALLFGVYNTPEGQAYLKSRAGQNSTPAVTEANTFEQSLKSQDATANKLLNRMYSEFSAATPDQKQQLLSQWQTQGLLNKQVMQEFINRRKKESQQNMGDYAKAFMGLSNTNHKALYLIKVMGSKSPQEQQIILSQLQAAHLLNKDLLREVQRLRSSLPTQNP